MTYADLSALILAAVALFVGVLLPLFGAYGYILAKHEAVAKSQETISNEMKNGGMLHRHVEETISKELRDESGVLRQFIDFGVKQEVSRRLTLKNQRIPADDWGNEADEYGEFDNRTEGTQQ